ncbi:MAG: hypothetical protein KJ804_16270 [Proteobacteria bacterium]|nr:hypothetical protein [Pseudomonadota bacterium]
MRALTAAEIIRLWETAYRFHAIDQALSILQLVMPEQSRDDLAALPLGQRDALLLSLRQVTFGDLLPGKSHCPQCGETVEFELSCRTLVSNVGRAQQIHMTRDAYQISIRPLNSFDLAAAAGADSLQEAHDLLMRACVAEACYQGQTIAPQTLPPEIKKDIAAMAEAADPQAEILLTLNCPACGQQWQSVLDVASILGQEITARAQRLLLEVHLLAKAYGWVEAEILNLSPTRRATYLQMVTP